MFPGTKTSILSNLALFTSFLGEMPQTPACPTLMCLSLPVTDCHLLPSTLVPLHSTLQPHLPPSTLYLAPALRHTVSLLSTAHTTPVGPTLGTEWVYQSSIMPIVQLPDSLHVTLNLCPLFTPGLIRRQSHPYKDLLCPVDAPDSLHTNIKMNQTP